MNKLPQNNTALPNLSRRSLLQAGGVLALTAANPWLSAMAAAPAEFDWTLRPPEEAGMSKAGIAGIRAFLQKQIDNGTINGVVSAVVRNHKLVWYEAQGMNDPIAGTPMRKDSIFRMMSSTKPVTAVAVLTMLDEGKLDLDDPVSRFIPEFRNQQVAVAEKAPAEGGAEDAKENPAIKLVPAEREVTIKDLLTHTSGITAVAASGAQNGAGPAEKIELTPDDTLATWAPKVASVPLDFQPGSKFAYSPTDAWDVLLRVVEVISGQTADVFMQERLFQPLGMVDTGFKVPAEQRHRIVGLYGRVDGEWQEQPSLLEHLQNHKIVLGGGGLCSTVHDFINFELMLLDRGEFNGHRILQPATVDLMATNQVGTLFADWIPPMTGGHGFGLGVRIVEDPERAKGRSVGGFGWGGAYGTESWAEPERDLVAAMFLQLNPPPLTVAGEFGQAVYEAIVK